MMSESWKTLENIKDNLSKKTIKQLFDDQPDRFYNFSLQVENIFFDYSKNLIDQETINMLLSLLKESGFENWRNRYFMGEKINKTDNRAVLHTALRQSKPHPVLVDGKDVSPDVAAVKDKMRRFCKNVRDKTWRGHSGKPISHIVHIGIGGSQLGPSLVVDALATYHDPDLTCDFVSNIDAHDIERITKHYNPETTLFLIASKSFTTQETMMNAHTARKWVLDHYGDPDSISSHFVALSTNEAAVSEFGIDPENMFEFWDWVGGRYSLWSSIGLVIPLMIGMDRFEDLLDGAGAMDDHFRTAPPETNLPVLLGLTGIWNRNFLNYPAYTVVPYDQRLSKLPLWLQQVDMESNGKTVTRDGMPVDMQTGPMIMGGAGTDVQHSYFQWMHQGTAPTPSDFIICAAPDHDYPEHHKKLVTHFLAQQQALMEGIENKAEPHRSFPGNRPSNAFILDRLTPYTLGQLLAAYEHKIFVQGIIWNINSFDQYGVELGKTMAKDLQDHWDDPQETNDSSTLGQLNHIKGNFSV